MKFFKSETFEKHFKQSLLHHISPLYLLMLSDPFERKFLAQRMVDAIGVEHIYVYPDALLNEINSPSFFSHKYLCICDNIEKYMEKTLPLPSHLIMILMGKSEPSCIKTLIKKGVILDLVQEKPWERKKRLQRWLVETAYAKGYKLKDKVINYLLQFYHADFSRMLQELEKGITYAGNEKALSLEKLQKIASPPLLQTEWQLSEAFVWGGNINLLSAIRECRNYYALIHQIRYQLHIGLTLAIGGIPQKLSPKRCEKFKPLALSYTPSYFLRGIQELFMLEQKMRTTTINHIVLLEYFYAKLRMKDYALSPT